MKRSTSNNPRRGFTLIELSIVVLIIGLITAFIAVVGFASAEQARVRATQGLITKLEGAINERLAALVDVSLTPNGAHRYLGSIQVPSGMQNAAGQPALPWGLVSEQRAYVIAQMDYLKREMPDVFYIQGGISTPYPVNFAGLPYPLGSTGDAAYILPLGNRAGPGYNPVSPKAVYTTGPGGDLDPDGDGNPNVGPGAFAGAASGSFGNPTAISQQAYGGVTDAGIYGASYSARSALNELIGYNPIGTDGVDNNSDGYVDDVNEGTNGGSDAQAMASINKFLNNHTHVTARSETLYALLVNGSGPLGSLFRPDEFTSTEVRDTDNDGVPEFVDGWGNPLQFYRWPIYYPGGSMTVTLNASQTGYVYEFSGQRGSAPYQYPSELREMFPFDQNKLLVSPAWFGSNMGGSQTPSTNAAYVMNYFTSFVDPNWSSSGSASNSWDMTGFYPRAEFASKFLVLSAGPDEQYGVNMITDATIAANVGSPSTTSQLILGVPGTSIGEDWAAFTNGFPSMSALSNGILSPPDEASDNITNLGSRTDEGGVK